MVFGGGSLPLRGYFPVLGDVPWNFWGRFMELLGDVPWNVPTGKYAATPSFFRVVGIITFVRRRLSGWNSASGDHKMFFSEVLQKQGDFKKL